MNATTEARFLFRPGERLDDLWRGGMRLIQSPAGFCLSLDSVLLAAFAHVKRDDHIWDLGTGTGALALLLAARGATSIVAVENDPMMADIARRNVAGNGCTDRITVREADYRHWRELAPAGAADLVVVNPPYYAAGSGAVSRGDSLAAARHERTTGMTDVVDAARWLLRYGGRFALVQRAERAAEWIAALAAAGFATKRLRWIHSAPDRPAKLLLLEARRGGGAGLTVEPPLVTHRPDGSYTDEVMAVYGKGNGG